MFCGLKLSFARNCVEHIFFSAKGMEPGQKKNIEIGNTTGDDSYSLCVRSANDIFGLLLNYLSHLTKKRATGCFELTGVYEKNGVVDFRMFPFDRAANSQRGVELIHESQEGKVSFQVRVSILEEDTVVGLNNHADKFRRLNLEFASRENCEAFLTDFYNFNLKKDKEKVSVYVYRNYWSLTSNLEKRKMGSIFLSEQVKNDVILDMENFRAAREKYRHFGIPYKRNYLFVGPPGTGKTSFIFSLASHFKLKIYVMNFTNEINDYEFTHALTNTDENNSLLLLEDIDSLFVKRESQTKSMITFAGLINCLDGISRKEGLITIMTTNHINKLDAALKRPGRVDKFVEFTEPSKETVQKMFVYFLPALEKEQEIFEAFYEKLAGMKLSPALLQNFFFEFVDLPLEKQRAIADKENIKRLKSMDISDKNSTGSEKKATSETGGLYM